MKESKTLNTGVNPFRIRNHSLKERALLSFKRYWLIYLLILPGIVSLRTDDYATCYGVYRLSLD